MAQLRRWFVNWSNSAGTGGGGTSTFWFESATGTSVQQARLVDILDGWAEFAHEEYSATIQPTVDIVDDTNGQIVDQVTITPAAAVAGTETGIPCPNQSQIVAALKTGVFVNGRRLQGRVFFPGVSMLNVLDGEFDTSQATALVAALAAGGMVVFSPTHLTSDTVTTAVVGSEIKVLRRRRD